jgi:hypothetical protein
MAVKKLGRGNKIKFWKEVWIGEQSLQQRFPRLFGVSLQQESLIHEMGERRNGEWRWELLWRRNFFVWERELLRELEELIRNVVITEVDDKWMWRPNGEDGFSVKSTYVALDTLLLNHNVLTTEDCLEKCSTLQGTGNGLAATAGQNSYEGEFVPAPNYSS